MGKPERRHQGAESGDASPADTIYAYGGDDNILSGIGNDTVYAGAGHDTVNAGDGNDIVYGEGGDDRLMGHNGNDALYGGAGHDELYGGAGNDILDGGAGSDILKAEAGDDMLLYRHADGHTGGDMDIYDGGAGRDVLRVMLTSGEYSVALYKELQELRAFIAQNQNTNATAGPSFVLKHMGLSVSNIESLEVYVDGGLRTSAPTTGPKPPEARDDLFHVRKGQVFSGNLLANNGNGVDFDFNGDTLQVTAGTKATARGGSVTINANGTFSYTPLAGFVGDDSFSYTLSDGKGGTDTGLATMSVYPNAVLGNFYNNGISGTAGDDILIGGIRNDTLAGQGGDDILNGDGGFDTASYALSVGPIAASLATGKATGEGNDTFRYVENLIGSAYNDTLTGDAANNRIEGGAGNDILNGGAGIDTVSYAGASSRVAVNLSLSGAQNTLGAGTDIIIAFENIIGSAYNDTLTGDAAANVIEGGAGNDVLNGGAGVDTASYASASAGVRVNFTTTAAQNTLGAGTDTLFNFENIIGSAYNDTLTGNSGANVIEGGAGNDIMDGGAGVDTVSYQSASAGVTVSLALTAAQNTGGAGTDTFLFDAATAFGAVDIVHGFSTAQGDKLKLADMLIGYNPQQSAIDKFVILTANGANTTLSVDRDGAGMAHTAKAIATLNGVTGLDVSALLENGNLLAA